jgi:hypothetical protein
MQYFNASESKNCAFAVMESRIEKYMAADANFRAAKTKGAFQQRAFKQAADNWLKVADDVERMERNRMRVSSLS